MTPDSFPAIHLRHIDVPPPVARHEIGSSIIIDPRLHPKFVGKQASFSCRLPKIRHVIVLHHSRDKMQSRLAKPIHPDVDVIGPPCCPDYLPDLNFAGETM